MSYFLALPVELRSRIYQFIAYGPYPAIENVRLVSHEVKREFDSELVRETVRAVKNGIARIEYPGYNTYANVADGTELDGGGSFVELTSAPKTFEGCLHLVFTVNPLRSIHGGGECSEVDFLRCLPSTVRLVTFNLKLPDWAKTDIMVNNNALVTTAEDIAYRRIQQFSINTHGFGGQVIHASNGHWPQEVRFVPPARKTQKPLATTDRAKVQVNWPNAIRITEFEQQALARWPRHDSVLPTMIFQFYSLRTGRMETFQYNYSHPTDDGQ
ncbi:hypothetical protein N0V83_000330 [Neocucurbitaria cava]|uniref:Uncharacterized protein n=1 Tax=Neocucurbitaria cava TaxID=798079 RepID=A0A9W8YJ68_9PLEO|nr:hypothetical protein N0V83_000330 [Neocucurbitaria cava]